jgi:hypothetical protein
VDATALYAIELRHKSHAGASSGALAYAILTQCRALSAVETGERVSKQGAAAWTRERMPEWAWLIDLALECRLSRGTMGFGDDRSRAAADQFIGLLADQVGALRSANNRG